MKEPKTHLKVPIPSSKDDTMTTEYSSSRGKAASPKKNPVAGKDITSAVFELQSLLVEKEQDLLEREEAFEKRLRLFDQSNPTAGRPSDVLQLNVGGKTNVAVLRSTLTQFDGSMLASKFSGRWDDSLEKDKDGNYFIDQDPELFLKLISFMRLCVNNRTTSHDDIPIQPPKPTLEFCMMLDHYDLMQALYPSTWRCNWGNVMSDEDGGGNYGSIIFTSDSLSGISMLVGAEVRSGINIELRKAEECLLYWNGAASEILVR